MIGTEGVIICGKRGGPSFIEMKRVNPITLTCPRGFIPCSTETKATETVCLTPEQVPAECPIIDLVLVSDADLLGWDYVGYTVFDPPMGNSGLKIAVTKDKFRNYISGGAIMGIEVNTQQPCFGNENQAIILTKKQFTDLERFDFDKTRFVMNCPMVNFRENVVRDFRYELIG